MRNLRCADRRSDSSYYLGNPQRQEKEMKKRRAFYIRTFQCPDCGNMIYASKSKGITYNGHMKDLYCPWCKEDKTMEQIEVDRCK